MAIDTDLRAHLVADSGVQGEISDTSAYGSIQVNKIDQGVTTDPKLWLQRTSSAEELFLNGSKTGLVETTFDIECISTNIDSCMDLADAVKDCLHGYQGKLGTGARAYLVEVEDHDDNYYPKNQDDDAGYHIAALAVRILHRSS